MEKKEKKSCTSSISICPLCHEEILGKIISLGDHYQSVHDRYPNDDEIHQFRMDIKSTDKNIFNKTSKVNFKNINPLEKKIYHYCPVCDRSMGVHKNNPDLDTWEKVLKDHFNRRHESLCREPTAVEIEKFSKGTRRSKKGNVRALQGGKFSPR